MKDFEIQQNKQTLSIRCLSRIENIDKIILAITRFVQPYRNKLNIADFILVLRELVNNAYLHGNRKNSSKHIDLRLIKKDTCISVRIKDDGAGFDWDKELTRDINEEQQGKRGLWILKHYCPDFNFNKQGNCITIRFNLSQPSSSI